MTCVLSLHTHARTGRRFTAAAPPLHSRFTAATPPRRRAARPGTSRRRLLRAGSSPSVVFVHI
jgi:hypothetical protein